MHGDLLLEIAVSIVIATVFALIAKSLKQPLILAYIIAGVLIGPELGLKWIKSEENIETISEIGLILLLFLIGLELNLKKLLRAGKPVIVSGIGQFLICSLLGLGFFSTLGYKMGEGRFDLLYLGVIVSFSSTLIVVKLLYDKFELDTLPGRITLGILIFQDLWAILFLAVQPNLSNPKVLILIASLVKGIGLVVGCLLASRYVMPMLFRSIARYPELVLVTSLSWCFAISMLAGLAGLSKEMGALVAGASLSTFPYNLDVIAKVISIRDFFVTLFFVALGMKIPHPSPNVVGVALLTSAFLVISRFISIFPLLYGLKQGNRASLLPAINLSQISEFSLVIATMGGSYGHISQDVVSVAVFSLAITSATSTYMILYSHQIYLLISKLLKIVGLKDIGEADASDAEKHPVENRIVILGFYKVSSSFVEELERSSDPQLKDLQKELSVIDFNPDVHQALKKKGIKCAYGDVAHIDTLHHAGIEEAEVVISTIPDTILKGTDNLRIVQQTKRLCPKAKVIATAETISSALGMYEAGADYVLLPRLYTARHLFEILKALKSSPSGSPAADLSKLRSAEIEMLQKRKEITA